MDAEEIKELVEKYHAYYQRLNNYPLNKRGDQFYQDSLREFNEVREKLAKVKEMPWESLRGKVSFKTMDEILDYMLMERHMKDSVDCLFWKFRVEQSVL